MGTNNIKSRNLLESKSFLLDQSLIVCATDHNLDILWVNSIFEKLLNIASEEVLGKNFFEILSEYNKAEIIDEWLKKLSEGQDISKVTLKLKIQDVVKWVHLTLTSFEDSGFRGYLISGIVKDDAVQLKNFILANEKEEVFKDLKVAGNYFKHLLPSPKEFKKVTFQQGILFYQPMRFISGDWYFFKLHNRKLFLLVGDFMGHGIQAGLLTVSWLTILKKFQQWNKFQSPMDVVDHFVNKFNYVIDAKELGIHLSLAVIIYSYDTKTAEFISFNYPLYTFLNEFTKLPTLKEEILFFNWKKENYLSQHIHLQSNQWVYLFSDGVKDQYGDGINKPLGIKRLGEIISEGSKLPSVQETEQFFVQKRKEWIGTQNITDDITFIAVKF